MIAHIGGVPGEELIPTAVGAACTSSVALGTGRPLLGRLHPDRYGHLYEDAEDEIPERLDDLFNAHAAGQARAKKLLPMTSGRRDAR